MAAGPGRTENSVNKDRTEQREIVEDGRRWDIQSEEFQRQDLVLLILRFW